ITNDTTVDLTNLGYPGNADPATTIDYPAAVSPDGIRGPTGASGTGAGTGTGPPGSATVTAGPMLSPSYETGGGRIGTSVAVSEDGNTALVGAPGDNGSQGAAWVFTRSASGAWEQQGDKLIPYDRVGNGGFGQSVALSADGNTALIGGAFDDNIGAAWVF